MKLYINGSPKLDNSNSNYFLKKLSPEHYISYVYKDKFSEILKNIKEVDTIILSFPLYVDDVPNKVIELFVNGCISVAFSVGIVVLIAVFDKSFRHNVLALIRKIFRRPKKQEEGNQDKQ